MSFALATDIQKLFAKCAKMNASAVQVEVPYRPIRDIAGGDVSRFLAIGIGCGVQCCELPGMVMKHACKCARLAQVEAV